MERVFLDTNILLDFMCKRDPFTKDAYEIFRRSAIGKYTLVVSALSIINATYTAKKYGYHDKEINSAIINLFKILEISSIDRSMLELAFALGWKDTEDALQYFSAVSAGAEYIITRDKSGFVNSSITVLNPTEFLNTIQSI